ncbi:MAG TPA: LamG domain-containing protein [Candidatus Paceibacterota bacterium]
MKHFWILCSFSVGLLLALPSSFANAQAWLLSAPTGPTSGLAVLHLIQNLTNWLFVGFMLLAVVVIVLAGWQFISSGGAPESVSSARKKLLWAGVAVIIAVMSRGIPVVVASILGVGGGGGGPLPPLPLPVPIAHWNFNDGSGLTLTDVAGGNNGTIVGATWVAGKNGAPGTALEFNGTSDYAQVPDSPSLDFGAGADFSITAWIKADIGSSPKMTIVDKRVYTPPPGQSAMGYSFFLWNNADFGVQLSESTVVNAYTSYFSPGPDLRDGTWHYVAAAVDRDVSNGGILYVDGTVVLTFDPTLEPGDLSNTNDLYIGRHVPGFDSYFDGSIDDVKIWNKALTPAEVAAEFSAGP